MRGTAHGPVHPGYTPRDGRWPFMRTALRGQKPFILLSPAPDRHVTSYAKRVCSRLACGLSARHVLQMGRFLHAVLLLSAGCSGSAEPSFAREAVLVSPAEDPALDEREGAAADRNPLLEVDTESVPPRWPDEALPANTPPSDLLRSAVSSGNALPVHLRVVAVERDEDGSTMVGLDGEGREVRIWFPTGASCHGARPGEVGEDLLVLLDRNVATDQGGMVWVGPGASLSTAPVTDGYAEYPWGPERVATIEALAMRAGGGL